MLCRWLLLAAAMAGVFAMHVLDAGHDSPVGSPHVGHDSAADGSLVGHDSVSAGTLRAAHLAGSLAGADRDAGAVLFAADTTADSGSEGGDHPAMSGCILFLCPGRGWPGAGAGAAAAREPA